MTETERGAPQADLTVRFLLLLLVGVVLTLTVATIPGVRNSPGVVPIYDDWLQSAGYVLAALLVVKRAVQYAEHRLQWTLVALALSLRAAGFFHTFFVLDRAPVYPSLADVFWILGALALLAGVLVAAARHAPVLSRTLSLDALLGGVTALALSGLLLEDTLDRLLAPGAPTDVVTTNLAYPVIDVAMLVVVTTLVAATRGQLSRGTALLAAGAVAFAVVDALFLHQVTTGAFRPGSLLVPLSLAGSALIASSPWLSQRDRFGERVRAGLAVPLVSALLCLVVLVYATVEGAAMAVTLAAAVGIVLAMVRAYLTFVVDRRESDVVIAGKDEEIGRFQALVEASDDFIAIWTLDGGVDYVNPAGRRLIGLPGDLDLSGRHVSEFIASQGSRSLDEMRPGLAHGGSWRGESALIDHQGGPNIPVIANTFLLAHPELDGQRLLATVQRDIREIRATESELRMFQALVEGSDDFVAIAGVDGLVQYVNPAGRRLVGLAPDVDVTTATVADFLTEEGLRASIEIEQPAVIHHGSWQGESTLRNLRGGPPTPVLINSFLISHPESGEPWLLATVQRDITERRTAEQAAKQLAAERQELLSHLVEAQEAERARIAADVHDDSVQSLAVVDLQLGVLRQQLINEASPETMATLDTLRDSVGQANDRLRHLLFDLDSPAQRGDLVTALEEAAAILFDSQLRWQVTTEGEVDPPEAVRVTVYRIAKEAMVNVLKHASADRVVITVRAFEHEIEVEVTDDGVGMGSDEMSSPGHRGLTDMRDRARIAGGWIELDRPAEGGTAVRIRLPMSAGPAVDQLP